MISSLFPSFLAAGGLNPFSIDPAALVLSCITFLALLTILWKFAWGPILTMVEAREERIASAISDAEQDRESAKGMLVDYEQRVAGVEAEVAELREKGRADANAMRQDILAKANEDAQAASERAQREIDQARSQALEDIRAEAVFLGLAIAGKVVGRSVTDEDQKRLAAEVVAEVGSVNAGA